MNFNSLAQRAIRSRIAALLAGPALSAAAAAAPIAIDNPGFEADFADPGCFSVLTPTGWSLFDPGGINGGNDAIGVVNPTGSVFFPAGVPEGSNAALVFLGDQIGAAPMGLTQVLGDTLQADTAYTLTVEVGNIASGTGLPPCDVFGFFDLDNFPGYQVQLLAGGVVIAEDDNTLFGSIPEGEFALSTVSLTTDTNHPQLGQPLEIRLMNLNVAETPEDPGIEVDFDDVQLTAEPAGELAGDVDGDCDVDIADLGIVLANFGMTGAEIPGDADLDGDVDIGDLGLVLAGFGGVCP